RASAGPMVWGLPCVTTAALFTALGDSVTDPVVDVIQEHGVVAVDQVEEELAVALRAGQSGVYDADRSRTPAHACLDHLAQDTAVDLGVADDASLPHFPLSSLELRLDQHERVPAGLHQRQHRRQHETDADEGDVADEQVRAKRQL